MDGGSMCKFVITAAEIYELRSLCVVTIHWYWGMELTGKVKYAQVYKDWHLHLSPGSLCFLLFVLSCSDIAPTVPYKLLFTVYNT
jgi:hypothetical protein